MNSTTNLEHHFARNTPSSRSHFNCIWGCCLDYTSTQDKPLPSPLLGVNSTQVPSCSFFVHLIGLDHLPCRIYCIAKRGCSRLQVIKCPPDYGAATFYVSERPKILLLLTRAACTSLQVMSRHRVING